MSDPAMGNLHFPREELDFYPTPEWLSEIILHRIPPHFTIWEPGAGTGAMVNVLRKEGNKVIASDIKQYDFPLDFVGDFLTMGACPADVRAIVTNPPYSDDAEKFIRKAISFMRPVQGKVAMLMRHEYDTAATRMDLFTDPDFYEKIVITPRPRWIPGTKGAPRHSYAWYVWDFWSAKDRDFPRISYYKLLNAKRNKAYGD